MTAAQRGIFYAQQIDPDVPMSVAAFAEFRDAVDADVMDRAVAATAAETESGLLRLVPTEDGEPRTLVDTERRVTLGRRDFADADDPRAAAMAWIDEHRGTPTDLYGDHLLQTYLLRLGDAHHIWYCWGHHLAFDGYAAMYMMLRVAQHYTAIVDGTDVAPADIASMADIADFDTEYRESDQFAADREHWRSRLLDDGELPEVTSLSSRTAVAAPTATVRDHTLPADLVDTIRGLAKAHRVRPASVITAAVATYLARLNDRDEMMLSLPMAAREREILRTSAGLTSNVVPIRARIDDNSGHPVTMADLLTTVNGEIKEAVRHQKFRHEDISGDVLASPGGRRGFFGPMVNIMLFFEHIDFGTLRGELNVLSTGPVEDASINVYDGFTGGMRLDLEANPNVYSHNEIVTHHDRIIAFLERFVQADPSTPVTDLALMGADEAAAANRAAVGEHVDLGDTTLVDLLTRAACRHAGQPALVAGDGTTLSYDELTRRADAAADGLRARGIGPESVVGVALPRGIDQLVGLHATVRAGGAFLPIDPAEPAERLTHILDTASPALLIADDDFPASGVDTVDLAALSDPDTASGHPRSSTPVRGDHPAYVLFTSGSTGKPKGVMISHRSIVNRLRWMQSRYTLNGGDRVMQKTPATFDVSVWEFFWPLVSGAALVIPSPDGHRDPWYLRDIIAAHQVTTTHFVPSMLTAFAAAHADDIAATADDLDSLRQIFTSGEALTPETVAATARLTDAPVHNLYGPTEAAIDVTFHDRSDADATTVPIGAPVWNTGAYVLDHRLAPQPVGAVGELYLGGVQLARGYVHRADLTAGRFVADPSGCGERLYRTGDLVRRRADGELEYLGRSDSQVKIRGQRVELGEIEAALHRLDGVRAAAVVVRDDLVADSAAVVGYVTGDGSLSERDLRAELTDHLPDHMVPTAILVLDDLPTTANGKLDRRALPAPERPAGTDHLAPRNPLEELVARTVAAVIGVDSISMSDNFFAVGGNSLSATRVAARLSRATGERIGIRTIFDAADIAGVAAALVAAGVSADEHHTDPVAGIPVAIPTDPVPLSPAATRLWLTNRMDRSAAATYNIPFTVRLVGALDTDALSAALLDVVARHEPLRTRVTDDGGSPYADIIDAGRVEIDVPVSEADDTLPVREFAAAPFDLAHDLPIRARIVRTGDDDHNLTVVIHHIAADGWSLAPLATDLAEAYRARRDGQTPDLMPLPVTYSEVSARRHAVLDATVDDELSFWRTELAGSPGETELPFDRPRTRLPDPTGATIHSGVDATVHRSVRQIADSTDSTVFMVCHAMVAALLRGMSQNPDITVGTPVSGRGDAELDPMVGMFVNTVVLRTGVDKDASFADLLERVRDRDLAAFEHAEVPFDRLVTELNPERGSVHPLFQVSVAVEDSSAIDLEFAGLSATASRIDTGHTKFDLQFTFTEHTDADGGPGGLGIEIGYATALFDRATVAALAQRLRRVIDAVVRDPQVTIGDVSMLDPMERLDLVPAVGAGRRPVEHLSRLLDAAVSAEPQRTALSDRTHDLTYAELDDASNRLARLLIAHGAGPERFVAVSMPRGVRWMVTLWAIARSGAAWVPVDPDYPAARIAFMIENSGAALVVTDSTSDPGADGVRALRLDDDALREEFATQDPGPIVDADRRAPLAVDHPAYLIYTSGTTGTPKGVVVSHRGLSDFAAEQVSHFGLSPDSRTMQLASPSFDASVLEVLMAVSAAATMHIVPPGIVGGRELADIMRARRVTHAFLTPSLLTTMDPDELPDLRTLVIGGEHPNPEVVRRWSARRSLFNAYGPTETTVVATMSEDIDPADEVLTIGRPIRGIAAMVLDERLRPVAPGAVGELYIAGPHLARGYHGVRPLTSKSFVANPYGDPGDRMYRTGDLVRWTADRVGDTPGSTGRRLEFRGRADHQIKIRGHRIELGEIDAALVSDDAVSAAVTTTHGEPAAARLVAYVTLSGAADGHVDDVVATVRDRLSRRLPKHMVPSVIIELDEIPTTPIGKVDLRALPAPDSVGAVDGDSPYMAPRTAAERTVAALVADHLGIDAATVGRDHDFFDLGGNSLSATQLVAGLEEIGGRRISVRDIFDHSTIAALARLAAGEPDTESVTDTTVPDDEDSRPLSLLSHDPDAVVAPGPAQQQLWFLNRLAQSDDPVDGQSDGQTSASAYNIAFALDLRGDLDIDALSGALLHAVERHEPLRTVYPERDGRPVMEVRPADDVIKELTAQVTDHAGWTADARHLAGAGFDLTVDAPIRVALHRLETGDGDIDSSAPHHKLTIVVHHIAADGWSMTPLARDIAGAYADLHNGRSPAQAPLTVDYRDYLRWQAENLGVDPQRGLSIDARELDADVGGQDGTRLGELAHWWRRELEGIDASPVLLPDHDSAASADDSDAAPHTGVVEVEFDAGLRARLRALADGKATEFMTVHAVFAALLHRLNSDADVHVAGADADVVIGTPVAGRNDPRLSDLVGMFVNSVVLRTPIDGSAGFGELLDTVRRHDLEALSQADLPFEQVVAAVNPPRSGRHPLFGVVLAFDAETTDGRVPTGPSLDLEGLQVTPEEVDTGTARFDLELRIRGDRARFTYAGDVLTHARVESIADAFVSLARQIVADPRRRIDEHTLTTPRPSALPAIAPRHLADILETSALGHADTVAIDTGTETVTYRELDERSSAWAHRLTMLGVGTEDVIAVALERSIESVVAVWAVAKAGAAVLPIDPRYPAERVTHMLTDSGAILGITTAERFGTLPQRIWWVSTVSLETDGVTGTTPARPAARLVDSTAYVIYTSGSTGEPKGVNVTHRGLAAFSTAQRDRHGVTSDSRTLHFASPSFDAAMLELLLAVEAGAAMVIAPPTIYGGDELVDVLAEQSVSHAFITPAALSAAAPRDLPDLQTLAVGGEASPPELIARWAPGRSYLNCYGPTETTIVTTMSQPLSPGDEITIGTPIDGATALVLDHRLRPLPGRVPGELYLVGDGVARGYLNRTGLTATRFVAAPDADGRIMYRTGDVVSRRPDGALIYHGRSDNQVKVRGFRIELDEVTSAINRHAAVDFATTLVHGTGADATLVSYVTIRDDVAHEARPDGPGILAAVRGRLPAPMVPASITVIDRIPLTRNGKLDRAALPTPASTARTASGPAPESLAERLVAQVLGDVLGVRDVSSTDDFFELGGTSLQATTLTSRLNHVHRGQPVRVREVFDNGTVAELAALIDPVPEALDEASAPGPLAPVDRPSTVPLAPVQRRLWSVTRAAPDSTQYTMPFSLRLTGRLSVDALRGALEDVVTRHTSLRTVYPVRDGEPVGIVLDEPADVVGSVRVHRHADPVGVAEEICARPFDLTVDAPFRAAVASSGSDEHVLILAIHHIAADGASLPVLVGDLLTGYRERLAGRAEPWRAADVDFRDYAVRMASEGLADDDLAYWTARLADAPTETTIPATVADDAPADSGALATVAIDDDVREGLTRFVRDHNTTAFSVLHSALAILLHRMGLGRDVVVGTPVANRSPRSGSVLDFSGVVGMFVNTLALRTRIEPGRSVADMVAEVRDDDLEALDHRDVPFDDVVSELNPLREAGRHPLFQIALSVHDFADGIDGSTLEVDENLGISVSELDTGTAKFDLQFTVTGMSPAAGNASVEVSYAAGRYRREDVELLIARLMRVVRAMICDPQRAVGDIRVTDPLEVARFSPVTGPHPSRPVTFGTLLDEAVRRNPNGLAAVTEHDVITYADLDARANRLARVLLGRGIGSRTTDSPSTESSHGEPVVAMAVPRSIDALVAIWAIIRSGAAYVPIDPTYPADRIAHMLDDSGACLVVTTGEARPSVTTDTPTIVLDDPAIRTRIGHSSPAPLSDDERTTPIRVDQLAYIIYTSGSTGKPKGVLVPHSGLTAVRDELRDRLAPNMSSRVLHFASPSFDASVLEFLLASAGAATLVVVPTDVYGGAPLADFVDRHGVTHAFITPAAVASMDPHAVPTLQALAIGGEAFGNELVRRWAPGRTLVNVYGPTETTVITTGSEELSTDADLTIGTPNNGVAALVLDERLHPVPPRVTGELYLIGDQVTRGYHRRPDLTSVRFVPAPMVAGPRHAGCRMYRTGDLVRWTDDGRLRYVGRGDNQVQVRGFRIELGEIDDALAAQPAVDFAVTVVDDPSADGGSGPASVRSYVTATRGHEPDPEALRRDVAALLPRHMVPASITVLDEIPMTPVGKLDRRALPEPQRRAPSRAPRPGTESAVAAVFADVLDLDVADVGAEDGFFDLGGNSLMATAVTTRLSDLSGRDINAGILFTAPTPAELAAIVDGHGTPEGVEDRGVVDPFATVLPLRRARSSAEPVAPLFVVHPAIGLSWSFTSLLPHIDPDRPVYGLQNPMLSGGAEPQSVSELAALYIERMREIAPAGPYHLLGWSLGGLIAQEMAIQLHAAGDVIDELVLLDSFVVADRPGCDETPSVAELLAEFGLSADTGPGGEPTIAEAWQAVRDAGGSLGGLTEAEFGRVHRAFLAATPLAADWRPRTYHGDAVFVTATADPPPGGPAVGDWAGRITGTVTEFTVDCSHARMLLPENVSEYSSAIDRSARPRRTNEG
ncbi:amino acid adenylation domain-containing protein [Gordonia sp. ABSL11-1]|uniref:non-ribosomal peptide synthetase n=1 Tax=Gordonia sp. ABSL11-1 TaxID=3053924 RepID=UPI00257338AA|nr:non-ribosomal peptide synthetase [Gordonia sp. ABSL11-1]MDL9944923.1 amino acid adenylation domain-containing protein [Gordonia sp. ABSL11-1]